MIDRSQKITYIRDVSKKYGLTIYSLRYYEKIGLFKVPRNKNGIRQFNQDSLARVNAIVHYRRAGLTIKQIKNIFKTPNQDDKHLKILFQAKEDLNKKIKDLQETEKYLNFKIDYHRKRLDRFENELKDKNGSK